MAAQPVCGPSGPPGSREECSAPSSTSCQGVLQDLAYTLKLRVMVIKSNIVTMG